MSLSLAQQSSQDLTIPSAAASSLQRQQYLEQKATNYKEIQVLFRCFIAKKILKYFLCEGAYPLLCKKKYKSN